MPDEDRIWLSAGASYDVDEHATGHTGCLHLFAIDDPVVGLRGAPGGAPTALTGTQAVYDGGPHIFSIGGSLKF